MGQCCVISQPGQKKVKLLRSPFSPWYTRGGSLNRHWRFNFQCWESPAALNDRCHWSSSDSEVVQESPRESLFKDCYFVNRQWHRNLKIQLRIQFNASYLSGSPYCTRMWVAQDFYQDSHVNTITTWLLPRFKHIITTPTRQRPDKLRFNIIIFCLCNLPLFYHQDWGGTPLVLLQLIFHLKYFKIPNLLYN